MSASQDRLRGAFGQQLGHITHHSDACPDCDADLQISEPYPGVFITTVMHDDTCPSWANIQKGHRS